MRFTRKSNECPEDKQGSERRELGSIVGGKVTLVKGGVFPMTETKLWTFL